MGKTNTQNNAPQPTQQDRSFGGRIGSLGSALATTISAPISFNKDLWENAATNQYRQNWKNNIDDIYRKYGFQNRQDYDNQLYAAEDAGDQATMNRLLNMQAMNDELRKQASYNNYQANNKANNYNDWRQNSFVGKAINQGQNGYAGSIANAFRPAGSTIMQNIAQKYTPLQRGVGVNNAAKFNPATTTGRMIQDATNRLIQNRGE